MPVVRDYRRYAFTLARVNRCGKFLGRQMFWKLYDIENVFRTVIASVLSAQVGPNWWTLAVAPELARKAQRFRIQYTANPQHASPGNHDIYLVFLSDLTDILRANRHQFAPILPDIDAWIVRLESIRLPRNLIGHMNFINQYDRNAIDDAHNRLPGLIATITAHPMPLVHP